MNWRLWVLDNAEKQRGCCRVVVPCQVCSTDFFTCEVVLSQKGPDFSSTDLEQTRDNSPCQVLFHARDPFSAAWQGTDMGVILGDRESKLIYSWIFSYSNERSTLLIFNSKRIPKKCFSNRYRHDHNFSSIAWQLVSIASFLYIKNCGDSRTWKTMKNSLVPLCLSSYWITGKYGNKCAFLYA